MHYVLIHIMYTLYVFNSFLLDIVIFNKKDYKQKKN